MNQTVKLFALGVVVLLGAIALPTLITPHYQGQSPYLGAVEKAAMPTASAYTCNGFECVREGQVKACQQIFDQVNCTATVDGNNNPSCINDFNCDL